MGLTDKEKAFVNAMYADKRFRIAAIDCCKCFHRGRKLVCRECGHHICLSCKEPTR